MLCVVFLVPYRDPPSITQSLASLALFTLGRNHEYHNRIRSPNDSFKRRLLQRGLLNVFSLESVSSCRWKYMVIAMIVTLVVILVSVFFGKKWVAEWCFVIHSISASKFIEKSLSGGSKTYMFVPL